MTTATHPYDALMDITARPKAVFVRGAGSYLWDDSRKRYLDLKAEKAKTADRRKPTVETT